MPTLQAALGENANENKRPRKTAKSRLHEALVKSRIDELKEQMTRGGVAEGLARALLYVRAASGTADERGLETIRRIRSVEPAARQMKLEEFKALIREQYFLLLIDEETALATIPQLLPEDTQERSAAFARLLDVLESRGQLTPQETERLTRLASVLNIDHALERSAAAVPIKRNAS
jgi:hypothetical protein